MIKYYNYTKKPLLQFFVLLLFSNSVLIAQNNNVTRLNVDWDVCTFYPEEETHKSSIPVSNEVLNRLANRGTACSTFIVNYSGFTPEAEAAFQYAVDIWSNSIESSVPIRISATFGPLDPGVLGGAGPTNFIPLSLPGVAPNTAFPIALAEKLTGSEIPEGASPTSTDISATFSSTANFYFGLDANTPPGQIDFVSVVLHELGHGLGIVGFAREDDSVTPSQGALRFSNFTSIWDNFIENGVPNAITSFADPSIVLLNELTSNDLFSNSTIATNQNGGTKPATYAPGTFNQGSSYSHWDEATFPPGNINSLMTPFIAPGEANHNPGPITLGFMEDMGWSICGGTLDIKNFEQVSDLKLYPNPSNSILNIEANSIGTKGFLEVYNILGKKILSKDISLKEISQVDVSNWANGLYLVKISSENGDETKRFLKQ